MLDKYEKTKPFQKYLSEKGYPKGFSNICFFLLNSGKRREKKEVNQLKEETVRAFQNSLAAKKVVLFLIWQERLIINMW